MNVMNLEHLYPAKSQNKNLVKQKPNKCEEELKMVLGKIFFVLFYDLIIYDALFLS